MRLNEKKGLPGGNFYNPSTTPTPTPTPPNNNGGDWFGMVCMLILIAMIGIFILKLCGV